MVWLAFSKSFSRSSVKVHAISGMKDPVLEDKLTCLERMRLRFPANWKPASVCLFAEQSAAVPQRSMCRSEGRKRSGGRRSGRRKPPLMRSVQRMQLVTSARFVKWNGRGREGEGPTGSPWSVAIRAMVTALMVVVKSWNQDMKRKPTCWLVGPRELKKSVMLLAGRSTQVDQYRFGRDVGDRKQSDSATE